MTSERANTRNCAVQVCPPAPRHHNLFGGEDIPHPDLTQDALILDHSVERTPKMPTKNLLYALGSVLELEGGVVSTTVRLSTECGEDCGGEECGYLGLGDTYRMAGEDRVHEAVHGKDFLRGHA